MVIIDVTRAHGAKCQRCWRYTRCWAHEQFPERGPICGRCRYVVDSLVESGALKPDVENGAATPEEPCEICRTVCKEAV